MIYVMTQPESPRLTRPAIGVLVDPERMAAARKSAMLERAELAALSQTLDLRKIAAEENLDDGLGDVDLDQILLDMAMLRKILADAGLNLKKPGLRIGVSRDEIAKLETGGRKRPKITTLRKLIDALNYARTARGKPSLDIEDLQVPGEVLIPEMLAREAAEAEAVADEQEAAYQDGLADWERDLLDEQARRLDEQAEQARQDALDAYAEASNEIYYAERDQEAG